MLDDDDLAKSIICARKGNPPSRRSDDLRPASRIEHKAARGNSTFTPCAEAGHYAPIDRKPEIAQRCCRARFDRLARFNFRS